MNTGGDGDCGGGEAGSGGGGMGTGGGMMAMRSSPFTVSQWQELEHQALIFKYMMAGLPVPLDLVLPIQKSFESISHRFFHHPTSKPKMNFFIFFPLFYLLKILSFSFIIIF